jgi:hypothetical protein
MKSISAIACLVVAIAGLSVLGSRAEPQATKKPQVKKRVAAKPVSPRIRKFMRAKLTASQDVLEGLVTEDYGKIQKGAQTMLVMSKAADFQVFPTPTYSQYAGEFRRAVERLSKTAKNKQLDTAALNYMHVTMTCVNCHKYVAKEKIALGKPLSPGLKLAVNQDRSRSRRQKK